MKNGKFAGALGVFLAAILVTWGAFCAFGGEPAAPERIHVELVSSSEEASAIAPGEAAAKDSYVKNTGTVPCYVRIRVDMTAEGDKDLFSLGDLSAGKFREKSFIGRADETEYWSESGGYYYYRNNDSGDALAPGTETPKLFTAIARNSRSKSGGAVEVIAEAVKSGEFASSPDAWENR